MIQLIARCMAFHPAFSKTKLKFKMWFLRDLSIKIWFQALLGHGNESRRWRNQIGTRIGVWTVRISWKFKGESFRREEQCIYRRNLGATVRWRGASRSMVAMKRPLIESLRLSPNRLIADEGLRWVHVSQFEESRCLIICWILIQRSGYVEEPTDRKWSPPL